MGGALAAAGERGPGYLWEVVARKALMNGRVLLHPAVLTAVAGGAAGLWFMGTALRAHVDRLVTRYPRWAAGFQTAGWGALAAALFNDSGVVAALYLLGAFFLSGAYLAMREPVPA
jgi:hypothetical protein